ncbi:hypothetical protein [Coleofasciculus chthonoplastes]|uniref:hypothetical protein n=1 Tax=Coleofasciculus chthonoplastes TaxID=64178 RepID=UPI0032F163D6
MPDVQLLSPKQHTLSIQLDLSRSQDKEKALQILGLYIKRFELLLRKKYANIGQDATACARAIVPLKVTRSN